MPCNRVFWLGILATFLLAACNALGPTGKKGETTSGKIAVICPSDNHAEVDLNRGIKNYEDGDYAGASGMLQHALLDGLSSTNQSRAYKYLAFIHCVSDRIKQCQDAFKKALEVDPGFELQSAEAGHPVWGPVFRNIKGNKPAP